MKPLTLGTGHLWVPILFPVRNESTMIYHFIVDLFLTGTLEPRNDQLPKLEISTKFRIRIKYEQQKQILPAPPFFVNVCQMVLRAFLLKYIVFTKHC